MSESSIVKAIAMAPYKKLFFTFLLIVSIIVGGSFYLMKLGLYIRHSLEKTGKTQNIIVFVIVLSSIIYSSYITKQKVKLHALENFEEKKSFHKTYYRTRKIWVAGNCFALCISFLIVANWLFIYFSLAEMLVFLIYFPNERFFRKELKGDEIVFI
ncbi:MAG: hypothetical protein QM764_02340 [Chitinophagaceae bacterium]